MGISLLTALTIKTNDDERIRCFYRYDGHEKYGGEISLWKDGEFHALLISTKYIYKSEQEALKSMNELVKDIRQMELGKPDVQILDVSKPDTGQIDV